MKIRFRYVAMVFTAQVACWFGVAYAAADKPPVMVTENGSTEQAPITVVGSNPFNQAKNFQATGLYLISSIRHTSGASLQIYGLLHNGALLEVHARKGTGWATKHPGASSARTFSTAQFQQLISLSGIDLRNAAAKDKSYFTEVTGLKIGTDGTSTPTPSTPTAPPVKCKPVDPNCRNGVLSQHLRDWLDRASDVLVSPAHARMEYFRITMLGFDYEYNPQQAYAAFKGYGIQAVWSLP